MLSVPLISANVSPLGWMLALAAAVAYAVPAAGARRISQAGARIALRLAWVLHALALAWGLLGEQPHFGFAPALSDRKSTRLNSSHLGISYAVFCLKQK